MRITDVRCCLPPGGGVAHVVRLRPSRVLHALLEQPYLSVRVQRIPIKPLFRGIGARGGRAARRAFREVLGYSLGNGRQAGQLCLLIEHNLDPVLAEVRGEVGMI